MLLHWVIVLVGLAAVVRSEIEDCTREKLLECNNRDEELEDIDGMFPKKEFLDKNCGHFLSSLKCRIDFNDRCPDSEVDDESKINQPAFGLATDMCDDSSALKKAYLENVECYDGNAAEVLLCSATTFTLVQSFEESMQNRTDFISEEMGPCVGIPVLVDCVIESIADECGSEETSPLAEIMHRASDMMIESLCPADQLAIWEQEFSTYLEVDKKRKK